MKEGCTYALAPCSIYAETIHADSGKIGAEGRVARPDAAPAGAVRRAHQRDCNLNGEIVTTHFCTNFNETATC